MRESGAGAAYSKRATPRRAEQPSQAAEQDSAARQPPAAARQSLGDRAGPRSAAHAVAFSRKWFASRRRLAPPRAWHVHEWSAAVAQHAQRRGAERAALGLPRCCECTPRHATPSASTPSVSGHIDYRPALQIRDDIRRLPPLCCTARRDEPTATLAAAGNIQTA